MIDGSERLWACCRLWTTIQVGSHSYVMRNLLKCRSRTPIFPPNPWKSCHILATECPSEALSFSKCRPTFVLYVCQISFISVHSFSRNLLRKQKSLPDLGYQATRNCSRGLIICMQHLIAYISVTGHLTVK